MAMTREVGIVESSSLRFDQTVTGFSEEGRDSNTTGTSIGAGLTQIETISLSKSGYNAGRLHMEYESAQSGGNLGLQMYITNQTADATSIMSRQYGKSLYSKNGATLWLSAPTYSTFGDSIVIEDAWIDGDSIKIQFRNIGVVTRTLSYYVSWHVWQCDA